MKKTSRKKEKQKNLCQSQTNDTKSQQILPSSIKRNYYLCVLIIFVGVLCYSNSLRGPFVFDDEPNIVRNEEIHLDSLSPGKLTRLGKTVLKEGRPVARTSFALNYYFGKLDPFGYHLVNISIHLATAVLVYLFLTLTLNLPSLRDRYGKYANEIALLSSLLFVAHPIQTQAVNYIVQRMTSMAALFFIATLYCYAKARLAGGATRIIYFAVTVLAALLALGSKENAITLPIFIVIYEYYFWQKPELGSVKKRWFYVITGLILLLVLLAGILIRFDFTYWLNKISGQQVLTQVRVVIFYLSLLFAPLPSRLNLDYDFPLSYSLLNPSTTLFCLILVLLLIASSIYLAKKRPLVSFALIWFWGNLVLESSVLPLDPVFEHRLYLPSMGFFLLVSIFLVKLTDRLKTQVQVKRGIKALLLLALIVPLSSFTYQRNKVWQNGIVLWKDVVKKSPNKARPYFSLGNTYFEQQMFAQAINCYKQALKINPKYKPAETYFNMGRAYKDQGQLSEAIGCYKQVLKITSGHKGAHTGLGSIYRLQGKLDQAIAEHLEEIKYYPNDAMAYYNLGNAYRDKKQLSEAIASYKRALEIDPGYWGAHTNLGNIYRRQGKFEQAITEYVEEIKYNPNNFNTYYSLALVYTAQGRLTEAIEGYKKALALKPKNPALYNNLGIIYVKKELFQEAKAAFLKALIINADYVVARKNLGNVYLSLNMRDKAIKEWEKAIVLDPQDKKLKTRLEIERRKSKKLRN